MPWATDAEIRRYYAEDERDNLLNQRDRIEAEREGVLALAAILESCNLDGSQDDVIDSLFERADALSDQAYALEEDAADIDDEIPAERPFIYGVL